MASAKRHHYLPQRYQRGFSARLDGRVWVHSRTRARTTLLAPKNNAVESYFYSRDLVDGSKDPLVETFLAEKVEGATWAVLDALDGAGIVDANGTPDGTAIARLAIFVAYLLVRTPEYRRSASDGALERLQKIIQNADSDDAEALDGVALRMRMLGLGEFDREALRAEVRSAKEPGWYTQNHAVRSLLIVGNDVIDALRTLDVTILTAPPEEPFITTDNPLLLINASYPGNDYGVASDGVFKFVPLTKSSAISYGSRGRNFLGCRLDATRARRLNVDLASKCGDLIVGASEEQVATIAPESQSAWSRRTTRFPASASE